MPYLPFPYKGFAQGLLVRSISPAWVVHRISQRFHSRPELSMADPVDCQFCDDDPVSPAAVPILVLAAQEEERRLVRQALAARPEWKLRFVATEKEALKEVAASPPATLLMDMQDVEG